MNRTLSRPEQMAWARLARTPRIGPITFHRLVARYRGAAGALDALPRLSRAAPLTPPSAALIESELDQLENMGGRWLAACEPDYPPLLKHLDAPPPLLSACGDTRILSKPTIAIVGAREASAAAMMLAEKFAADLGAAGFAIVSGLARGMDAAAHRGSLKSGAIAVLAGGLDKPYPPQNLRLYDEIMQNGIVITEAPLGFQARARDFPRRNHIVSGIARAVIVIEAALRSGSLITARAAGEQGRDVMAVPGSPLDPRARGSNALIKNGATLVEDANDVIDALGDGLPPLRPQSAGPLFAETESEPASPALLNTLSRYLSPTPVHVNDLARLAEAPASAVAAALVELELEGRASSLPGGYAAAASASFRSD